MRGRKPKSPQLRVLTDGHPLSDEVGAAMPAKPAWLSGHASMEWDRLVPDLAAAGILCEADGTMLAAYCEQYAIWRDALADVERNGITYADQCGKPHPSPAVKVQAEAAAEMRRLAGEFGFTPASRARIRVSGTMGGAAGDEFDEFLGGSQCATSS